MLSNEDALKIAGLLNAVRSERDFINTLANYFDTAIPDFKRMAFLEEICRRECHWCNREFSPINDYYNHLCSPECEDAVNAVYEEAIIEYEEEASNVFNADQLGLHGISKESRN
jgi:hypothetical protein